MLVEEVLKSSLPVIDVRSPGEFADDHMPGSINIPLLDDEQRHIVGKLYHDKGKEKAFTTGYALVEKKLPEMLKQYQKYDEVIVYCFRGGMRSQNVVDWLNKNDVKAYKMQGGYKDYRKYVMTKFESYKIRPKIFVIYGLTGCKKTTIIQNVKNSIDLEGLAKHRSSLFGALGLNPVSQKMFESTLLHDLESKQDLPYLIFEGESRKVGNSIIPETVYKQMLKGINIKVQCDINQRAKHLLDEYPVFEHEKIKEIINKLPRYLSNKQRIELCDMIDNKKYLDAIKIILEKYYDILYANTVNSKKYSHILDVTNLQLAIKEVINFCNSKT